MQNSAKISILGDGGWGTTLSLILSNKGFGVTLWGFFPEYINLLKKNRENTKFLPGIKIPEAINMTSSIGEALKGRDIVILAIPSQHMRSVLAMLKTENLSGKVFVSVTKGIENSTLKRMSEVIAEMLGDCRMAVLSGPTIALEIANGAPATAVSASNDLSLAKDIQGIFMTDRFRVYATDDVIGVELGGSIKNVIAIASGVVDALGFGANSKAALLTRGLVEITRLGVAMGARRETIYGLSGLGDMTTTCISSYSRNRWFGEELGRGKKLKDILGGTQMVVEGVATTKSAYDLSRKFDIEMPIVAEVYRMIYEGKDPKAAVHALMTRTPKVESDG